MLKTVITPPCLPRAPLAATLSTLMILLAYGLAACGSGGDSSGDIDALPAVDAKLGSGQACTSDDACSGGFCTDGVCCNVRCDGLCEACTATSTGGTDGTCAPVSANTDPANECGEAACATAACDGSGQCGIATAGTTCRAAAGGCDVVETCNGQSTTCPNDVIATAGTPCDGYLCTGNVNCPSSCAADQDCAAGNICLQSACVPGARVFITSTTTLGNMGGTAGGDAICQNLANASNRRGTYKAWLSTSTTSPSTTFTQYAVPYYAFNGLKIADSWTDLTDGTIDAGIAVSDLGVPVSSNVPFTGTDEFGASLAGGSFITTTCNNWTSSDISHRAWTGFTDATNAAWTHHSNADDSARCNVLHRMYCFQQ